MADFTSRFNELLSRSKDSDSVIAETLGVSKQTVSAWKNGTRFPKRPAIRSIADHFKVGVPWLEGVTDDETAGVSSPLIDPQEQELLTIYRELNDGGQTILIGTARSLALNPDLKRVGASNVETA